jgi:hypothetical protein
MSRRRMSLHHGTCIEPHAWPIPIGCEARWQVQVHGRCRWDLALEGLSRLTSTTLYSQRMCRAGIIVVETTVHDRLSYAMVYAVLTLYM